MRRLLGIVAAFAVASALFSPAPPASAATTTPVVFVHGYTGSASNWVTAMSVFRAAGWSSGNLFAYECNSYGDNVTNARGLATYVSQVRSRTGACLVFVTCQQMYPGSSFIAQISAGDETPGATRYATWYSPCDGVILPYTSTRLDGATNDLVACQTHLGYLTDTGVLGQIAGYIRS
jgi:lipase (class 2)